MPIKELPDEDFGPEEISTPVERESKKKRNKSLRSKSRKRIPKTK